MKASSKLSKFRSDMMSARMVYMNEMAGLSMGLPDDPDSLSNTIRQIEERYQRTLEKLKADYKAGKYGL